MRTHLSTLTAMALLAGGLAAPAAIHAQENRGTYAQQLACTPDVWRLCGEQIPDTNRIVACLRQNMPQLSGSCRAVFDSNASAPNAVVPPAGDGVARPRPYNGEDD